MLEFVAIAWLYSRLAGMAEERGHPRTWGLLGGASWIVGEIIGFVIGSQIFSGFGPYIAAVMGAVAGAAIAWQIVESLPAKTRLHA